MTAVTPERLLSSVRSVPEHTHALPTPRPPVDEREHDGWQHAGRFEVHFDDVSEAGQ